VISFEEIVPSVEETRARIEATLLRWPWLVYEDGGEVLGYAYASKHRERAAYRWSVDVSVYVRENARGRGIGRSLYLALFRILREQGFHHAFAGIALPNVASIALHRSVGFAPVGVYREVGFKFGAWHDVAWMECAIQPPGTPPREPTPLPELSGAGLRRALG
jgi:L-amino acid N-acyltransferase YncA